MTRAAKPKRRPPFTTLATRLMWTSLSMNSLGSSRSRERFRSRSRGSRAMDHVPSGNRPFAGLAPVCPLKLQACFARRIRQRLDAAVIQKAAAIEHHFGHALLDCALGDEPADGFGGIDIGAGLAALAQGLFHRRRRDESAALRVIDDLGVDMLRGAEHREPQPAAAADLDGPAHARGTPLGCSKISTHDGLPLLLLAFLAEDEFACVFHALALIGFGRTERADLGGHLADLLLVDAGHHDLGRLRRR